MLELLVDPSYSPEVNTIFRLIDSFFIGFAILSVIRFLFYIFTPILPKTETEAERANKPHICCQACGSKLYLSWT